MAYATIAGIKIIIAGVGMMCGSIWVTGIVFDYTGWPLGVKNQNK